MKFSKIEILIILGAFLNAAAEFADLLPPEVGGKVTASLLALWAVIRFILRFVQASPASVNEIESLRGELNGRINEIQAKRAEPVKGNK